MTKRLFLYFDKEAWAAILKLQAAAHPDVPHWRAKERKLDALTGALCKAVEAYAAPPAKCDLKIWPTAIELIPAGERAMKRVEALSPDNFQKLQDRLEAITSTTLSLSVRATLRLE